MQSKLGGCVTIKRGLQKQARSHIQFNKPCSKWFGAWLSKVSSHLHKNKPYYMFPQLIYDTYLMSKTWIRAGSIPQWQSCLACILKALGSITSTEKKICKTHRLNKQKVLPRNGIFFVLAQEIAWSFPTVPRSPKPPGTRMPLKFTQDENKVDQSPF